MSASNSPDPASQLVVSGDEEGDAPVTANGHLSPHATGEEKGQASPVAFIEGDGEALLDAPGSEVSDKRGAPNGADEDANSEAETLIDSPVKKKEAEKQKAVVKADKPQKSRIGSLPVPGDDDDDGDSTASAMESREVSVGKGPSLGDAKEDVEMMDDDSDKENGSELSSARSTSSNAVSRASSRSRALSERPQDARNGSPNPRKRKHRASSMSLPNSKRQSMDPPKRTRLRGMNSEEMGRRNDRSSSPKRGHRRAVSTQSALDGTADGSGRKRKSASTYPGTAREPKSAKGAWEESDASSETTSRGQDESKRPQRGIGRSTSTPGRPGGREHKRHVNKYGFTRLAEACEDGNLELVRKLLDEDPEAIEVGEYAGNKPLQIAALNGNAEVVGELIKRGCQIDCSNADKDTPLIDAAENGHLEVVKLLLDGGVDPLRQNLKGQQALDVVTDDTEDVAGIRGALHKAIDHWNSSEAKQRREEEEEQRHRAGPSKELHLMARTYENLLRLVQNNDRNGVSEFLAARVPVDNNVIAAAAKTGDLYLVNMLLAEMNEKKASQKPEKPMLSVLGTSHFEMVKALTELDNFNPLWRTRAGKSWPELAEERNGPMWRQEKELLQRLYELRGGTKARRSSSPVTKRDGAKRRFQQAGADDESDDELEGTKRATRKNGRRLMNRKDMRAAGSKSAMSDSSEEDDDDEADETNDAVDIAAAPVKEEAEAEMRPPETPNTRRQLRSKSISSPSDLSPKSLRRRSNSTREVVEKALPTLDEKGEEKDSGSDGIVLGGNEDSKKQKAAAAKLALDEAKRLDEKRKQEAEAEAEVKRVEEELRKKEEQRKAEEERKAAEERAAQEAKRREEEAEQARKEEEFRKRREQEMEEAKRQFISYLLDVLPNPISHVIDPDSGFHLEGEAEKHLLLQQFTPLLALATTGPATSASESLVLNIQAAPLLGKLGLELFKSSDGHFRHSPAEHWTMDEIRDTDLRIIDRMVARMTWDAAPSSNGGDEEMYDADTSFEDEMKKAAERHNAFTAARRHLREHVSKIGLRRVKLGDVLSQLHPLLKGSRIDVEFVAPPPRKLEDVPKQGFVDKMKAFWETDGSRAPVSTSNGKLEFPVAAGCASFTDVVVVHEKRP